MPEAVIEVPMRSAMRPPRARPVRLPRARRLRRAARRLQYRGSMRADASRRWLPEPEVKRLLGGVGVRVPKGSLARDVGEVAAAAAGLAAPLVVKAVVPGLVHKSEVGAVRVGLAGAAAAARAAAEIAGSLA